MCAASALGFFFFLFVFFSQGYDCIQMIDGKAITFTSAHTCFFYAAFMFVALLFQVLFSYFAFCFVVVAVAFHCVNRSQLDVSFFFFLSPGFIERGKKTVASRFRLV